MAIAVIGLDTINFNRIVSSSVPPFSLSDPFSKGFKDDISLNKRIRALYIYDIDNAFALVYDLTNKWTEICTISFSESTIVYKKSISKIDYNSMTLGVIGSDFVYYVGTVQKLLY